MDRNKTFQVYDGISTGGAWWTQVVGDWDNKVENDEEFAENNRNTSKTQAKSSYLFAERKGCKVQKFGSTPLVL